MRFHLILIFFFVCALGSCQNNKPSVRPGAEKLGEILPLIEGKKIALVANHTSLVGEMHLVDTLLGSGVNPSQILKVFGPEHGFRGDRSAGSSIEDDRDPETGISIISLYGKNKKPPPESLAGVELVLFDLQDVGARFYTYISTLHYVMEACAEQGIPLIVLDRPNPNGGFVDGPVLQPEYSSFVGMHPIPVVYGLTIGELAKMINGEGWLENGIRCDLSVISCENYYHGVEYDIPVKPSPNLTSPHAVRMYPSTCFFEGTVLSEGRGTLTPFEIFGHPDLEGEFSFTPVSMPGMSINPKLKDQLCFGVDLRHFVPKDGWNEIFLEWIIDAYSRFPNKEEFFTSYFERLAGTAKLRDQIVAGWSEAQIRKSWKADLEIFKARSAPYMIYP